MLEYARVVEMVKSAVDFYSIKRTRVIRKPLLLWQIRRIKEPLPMSVEPTRSANANLFSNKQTACFGKRILNLLNFPRSKLRGIWFILFSLKIKLFVMIYKIDTLWFFLSVSLIFLSYFVFRSKMRGIPTFDYTFADEIVEKGLA